MNARGSTLIEVMVAVAILAIAAASLVGPATHHERAARRAAAVEGVARVLDQELERARACSRRACVEALVVSTATVTALDENAASWARASVERSVSAGPNGTLLLSVSAKIPGLVRERSVSALIWVRE